MFPRISFISSSLEGAKAYTQNGWGAMAGLSIWNPTLLQSTCVKCGTMVDWLEWSACYGL